MGNARRNRASIAARQTTVKEGKKKKPWELDRGTRKENVSITCCCSSSVVAVLPLLLTSCLQLPALPGGALAGSWRFISSSSPPSSRSPSNTHTQNRYITCTFHYCTKVQLLKETRLTTRPPSSSSTIRLLVRRDALSSSSPFSPLKIKIKGPKTSRKKGKEEKGEASFPACLLVSFFLFFTGRLSFPRRRWCWEKNSIWKMERLIYLFFC